MNILIIHNQSDQVRAQNIKDQFAGQTLKVDYEIIPAIMNPDQPCVGIMRSFKVAIKHAMQNNWKEVCIFEDDLDFLIPESLSYFFNWWNIHDRARCGIFL